MSTVYVLRTYEIDSSRSKIWIAFNETSKVRGKRDQSKREVIAEFIRAHKIDVTNVVRFIGICRPSEAIATIVDIQKEGKK